MTLEGKSQWATDLRITIIGLSLLLLFGLVALFCQTMASSEAHVGTAMLWAFACSISGTAIGFLFAIPKAGKEGVSLTNPSVESNGLGNEQNSRKTALKVNTNLEEVSDWLTKIVVGLGLINLKNIGGYLEQAANVVAPGIGGNNYQSIASALIIFFSVQGFLGGYLLTRLFFTRAFQTLQDHLDLGIPRIVEELKEESIGLEPNEQGLSYEAQEKAKKLLGIPLDKMGSSVDEIAVWSKVRYSQKKFTQATEGYKKAVTLAPNNIKLRIEYAAALFYAKRPIEKVQKQLDQAENLLDSSTDIKIKQTLYKALAFFCLYFPAPDGFKKAIQYGEKYEQDFGNLTSGANWVNLAAAYSQAASFLQSDPKNASVLGSTFEEMKAEALEAVRQACEIGEIWKKRLTQLLQKDYPNKAHDDDDLEVFEDDPEFRTVLGLPAK